MPKTNKSKLPNPDEHQRKVAIHARLRGAIEKLSRLVFKKETVNNMILRFVPHLKRTDRDLGALPLWSIKYTSQKPNKDHALLCIISMLVQVWWDVRDDNAVASIDQLDEFESNLKLLEDIASKGTSSYRMYGKFPDYQLMTLAEVDARDAQIGLDAAEEAACEAAAAESIKEAVKDAELGGNAEGPILIEPVKNEDETDTSDSDRSSFTGADQLSVGEADACCGDCDICTDKACEDDEAGDPNAATTIMDEEFPGDNHEDDGDDICEGGYTEPEHEADPREAQKADGEHYPDAEPLEQTAIDATAKREESAVPPMPEDSEEE